MASLPQGLDKCFTALLKGPIVEILVINKVRVATRKQMVGNEVGGLSMIIEDPSKFQMRTSETEINGWFCGADNKLRQVISRCQPGKDSVSSPSPRNDPFSGHLGGQMPAVFQRALFNTPLQPVII